MSFDSLYWRNGHLRKKSGMSDLAPPSSHTIDFGTRSPTRDQNFPGCLPLLKIITGEEGEAYSRLWSVSAEYNTMEIITIHIAWNRVLDYTVPHGRSHEPHKWA